MRTRGGPSALDYGFLGEEPKEFWWRQYGQVTDLEQPTILVESDGRSWQAYIAGIGSQRSDLAGRHIQFNLVLAGECEEIAVGAVAAGDWHAARVGAEHALALSVIGQSVADLGEQKAANAGSRLDSRLTQEDVDRMLASPGEATLAEAADAVRGAYGADSGPQANRPSRNEEEPPDHWLGGAGNPGARAAFVALAAQLVEGKPGRALMLNRPWQERGYLEVTTKLDGELGILITCPGPGFTAQPQPFPQPGPGFTGLPQPFPQPSPGSGAARPPGPRFIANDVGRFVGAIGGDQSQRGPAQDLRESWFRRVLRQHRSRRDGRA